MNPLVVGEIGINHRGDVKIAKALIGTCKAFGLDYVKFQKRTVNRVYSKHVLLSGKQTPYGDTKLHDKLGLEFDHEDYVEIDRFCKTIGMPWFASPWDVESVDFLEGFDPPYHKIASACAYNDELVDKLVATKRPLILSIGMHKEKEIPAVIKRANSGGTLKYVMLCSSVYPTPDNKTNLLGLQTLAGMLKKTNVQLGYSHHSQRVLQMPVAYALGAAALEFHVTLDKCFGGDDQMASVGPGGVKKLMEHLEVVRASMGAGRLGPSEAALAKLSQYEWVEE